MFILNRLLILFILLAASSQLYAVDESVRKFLIAARDRNIPLAREAIAEGVKPHYILGKGQEIENDLIMIMRPGVTVMSQDVKLTEYSRNNPEILKLFFEEKMPDKSAKRLLENLYRLREFDYIEKNIAGGKLSKSAVRSAIAGWMITLPRKMTDQRVLKHLSFLAERGYSSGFGLVNMAPEVKRVSDTAGDTAKDSDSGQSAEQAELDSEERRQQLAQVFAAYKDKGRDLNLMLGSLGRPRAIDHAFAFKNSASSRDALIAMANQGVDLNMSAVAAIPNRTIGSYIMAYVQNKPEYLDVLISAGLKFDFLVMHLKGAHKGEVEHVMAFILRALGEEAFEKVVKAGNSPVIRMPTFPSKEELARRENEAVRRLARYRSGRLDEAIKYRTAVVRENKVFHGNYLNSVAGQLKADPSFLIEHGVVFDKDILKKSVMAGRLAYAVRLVRAGANVAYFCDPPEFEERADWHHFMSVRERILDQLGKQKYEGYPRLLKHVIEFNNIEFTEAIFESGLNWATKVPVGDGQVTALRYAMEQNSQDLINAFEVTDEYLLIDDVKDYVLVQLQSGNQDYMKYRQRIVDAINQ